MLYAEEPVTVATWKKKGSQPQCVRHPRVLIYAEDLGDLLGPFNKSFELSKKIKGWSAKGFEAIEE